MEVSIAQKRNDILITPSPFSLSPPFHSAGGTRPTSWQEATSPNERANEHRGREQRERSARQRCGAKGDAKGAPGRRVQVPLVRRRCWVHHDAAPIAIRPTSAHRQRTAHDRCQPSG